MAEEEEWDLGDRSPRREIRPRLPRPRNNSRWIPLPQPATLLSTQLFFPLPPKLVLPRHQTATKQTSVQGSIMFFLSETNCWFACTFLCECVIKKSENDTEGNAVFCMYVFFFLLIPLFIFPCHFVELGFSSRSVMYIQTWGQ